jgi:hypothetical protein
MAFDHLRLPRHREAAMRLRRWHRLGIILTIVCGIGLFYYVYTRDDELGADVYYRQTNECRVAERRGLPADKCYREVERERARVVREKTQEAAVVTAGAIAAAWLAAFLSIGLYRWVMAGAPSPSRAAKPDSDAGGDLDGDTGSATNRATGSATDRATGSDSGSNPGDERDSPRGDKRRRRERIEPKI